MKKILLGLALGLGFAGLQAGSIISPAVSKCMSERGLSYSQCQQLERDGQLRAGALQIGNNGSAAQSSQLSSSVRPIAQQKSKSLTTPNYLVGY